MTTPVSYSRTRPLLFLVFMGIAVLYPAIFPASAHATVKRETLSNAEPTDLVNITPIRIEADVQPGEPHREKITIYNDSSRTINLTADIVDLGPPHDPTILGEPLELGSSKFGAGDWVTMDIDSTVLEPFEKITFDATITPPLDAPVGSSYAGLQFVFTGVDEKGGQIALKITSMVQLLLTVPGPVEHRLELVSAETRDAYHFGGTSFVSYGVRYANHGTVHEHVTGKIAIRSLFGNKVTDVDLGERILIRGATGTGRAVWSKLPRFGIFYATAIIEGDDGKVHRKEIGRIVLLPPWWVLALIAATLTLPPVYVWWRRRREWLAYLDDEDVEADEDRAF